MNLKSKLNYAFAIVGFSISISAHAELYIFGISYDMGTNFMNITTSSGKYHVPATDSGWWSNVAGHEETSMNYYVSKCCEGEIFNNFFTFNLSGISGTITSASLDLYNYDIKGSSLEYRLFDITSPLHAVHSDGESNNPIYLDLMTGITYGSHIYNELDSYNYSSILFNADGIQALNNAIGEEFGVGGTLIGGIETPVPEPETYAMLLVGLGLISIIARRRKQQNLLTVI